MSVLRAFASAVARLCSNTVFSSTVHTAATPNIATWVAPQRCKILAITVIQDVKTAITVLTYMAELDGVNLLASAIDGNAGSVRVPLAGVLTDVEGVTCPKDGVVTLDIDSLTGTNVSGIAMQIDWVGID